MLVTEYEIISISEPLPVKPQLKLTSSAATIIENDDQLHVKALMDPTLMALHNGSKVYVRKEEILKIFCDKPALYSIRLATLIFGEKTLRYSCMPDERDEKYTPLNEEILESIISNYFLYKNNYLLINNSIFPAHVIQVFKQQNKLISKAQVKNFIRLRLNKIKETF